jgi:hypothetical protein
MTVAKIFISYAHDDAEIAIRIVEAIRTTGHQVWIDIEQIAWGQSFLSRMAEGAAAASYLVLVVSPASMISPMVEREWQSVLAGGGVILPVLVAGSTLPQLLRDIVYVDLRTNVAAGLARITAFFQQENQPTAPARAGGSDPLDRLRQAPRRVIRSLAQGCLDEGTFADLCFDLEIDPGSLPGDSLHQRITSLLTDLYRVEAAADFVEWLGGNFAPAKVKRCIGAKMPLLLSGS